MTDHQFLVELKINAYKNQIDGLEMGDPEREHFEPMVSVLYSKDGSIDRVKILELPGYTFTPEQKELLLK